MHSEQTAFQFGLLQTIQLSLTLKCYIITDAQTGVIKYLLSPFFVSFTLYPRIFCTMYEIPLGYNPQMYP